MKALVVGGHGFIGGNLTRKLRSEGWDVTVVDKKEYSYGESPANTYNVNRIEDYPPDNWNDFERIYVLAAQMGGAYYVFTGENDMDILTDSLSITIYMVRELKRANYKGKVFYSSSVCVYPDGASGDEESAYPADPPSNYGWEKLTSERLYQTSDLDIRIARFHNTYGPWGTYAGGREKAPAALCRKAIQDDVIEVWGDGQQVRPFLYIDDLLDAIEVLMEPDFINYYARVKGPVNIGPDDSVTINQMLDLISDKPRKYVDGPTGEQIRHTNNDIIKSMGWKPKTSLKKGLKITKDWITWAISKP